MLAFPFRQSLWTIILFLLWISTSVYAQNTLELIQDGVNNSYALPVPKGPTSIPQTLAFFLTKTVLLIRESIFKKSDRPFR